MHRLVKWADVLTNNFRPGVLERWGYGYEEMRKVNPHLIYASNSGECVVRLPTAPPCACRSSSLSQLSPPLSACSTSSFLLFFCTQASARLASGRRMGATTSSRRRTAGR